MIELWQFRASPYNEKARWALDLKGVPHSRRSLLPGPHAAAIHAKTGQTATPILKLDGVWVTGSAAIVEALEARFPTPPLLPEDPTLRADALAIQQRFDEELGPRMRRATFGALLRAPIYLARVFAAGRSTLTQMAYGALIPAVSGLIRAANGITGPNSITDGERAIEEALAFIDARRGERRYLIGETFTVADMSAAAFIAMVVDFSGTPMAKPKPVPRAVRAWLARYADHPTAVWAREIYAKHRGRADDFDGAPS